MLDIASQLEADVGKAVEVVLAGARDGDQSAGQVTHVVGDISARADAESRTSGETSSNLEQRAERCGGDKATCLVAERDHRAGEPLCGDPPRQGRGSGVILFIRQ